MNLLLGPENLSTLFNFSIPTVTTKGNKVERVGVYSSGGHDSGAMLCLVMAELEATGRLGSIPVTAFTIVKGEGSTYYSQRVIDKVSEHFGVPIAHVNNLENNEPAYSMGRIGMVPIREIWNKNHHDMIIYMSVNRMAPDNIRPFTQTLKIMYPEKPLNYIPPFLNLHKPQITDIYYKLGCEDIIPYTHSCTVQAIGRCNECYSCKEREWGFSALGKDFVDTIPPDVDDISFGGSWIYPE
jgi:hypothetical protein